MSGSELGECVCEEKPNWENSAGEQSNYRKKELLVVIGLSLTFFKNIFNDHAVNIFETESFMFGTK